MTGAAALTLDRAGAPARGGHAWCIACAVVAGCLVGYSGSPLWLALGAFPLILATATCPVVGAAVYLLATPLIVGLGRDSIVPLLRPNELLLLLLAAAVAIHLALGAPDRRKPPFTLDRLDVALLMLATSGSVLPLLVRFGRDLPITTDDALYAFVLWKYLLVYFVFKVAVQTERQLRLCLGTILLAAAVVATIAVLQVLDLFGVAQFLWRHFDAPFTGIGEPITTRGTSTIASSFGVAGTMTITLVIALVWLLHLGGPRRWLLTAAAALFLIGCVVAGQFSGIIGLVVALAVVGLVIGRLRQIAALVLPIVVIAGVIFAPVIEHRLSDFASAGGMPPSWSGRLDNLERFVLPELSSGWAWLTGVRPAARVPAPEPWRDWVYIESGYVWLLWTGGVAMLGSFAFFVHAAGTILLLRAREARHVVERVAAIAAMAALTMIATLMLFDPHLTMRGTADLFFPLLAMAVARPRPGAPAAPGARPAAATPTHSGAGWTSSAHSSAQGQQGKRG